MLRASPALTKDQIARIEMPGKRARKVVKAVSRASRHLPPPLSWLFPDCAGLSDNDDLLLELQRHLDLFQALA